MRLWFLRARFIHLLPIIRNIFNGRHNNGMHPTALSVPLINLAPCDGGCVVLSGGG
jgi:hypothetical protein